MRTRRSDGAEFHAYFSRDCESVIHHDREMVGQLVGAWKGKLAQNRKQRGLLNQFLWHAFSFDCVPHKHGYAAREAYARQRDRHYLIWTASEALGALEFANCSLPTAELLEGGWEVNPHFSDLYVAAATGDWLFALTHERSDGLGPYFVKAGWCFR